jgi:hypothetical protein
MNRSFKRSFYRKPYIFFSGGVWYVGAGRYCKEVAWNKAVKFVDRLNKEIKNPPDITE